MRPKPQKMIVGESDRYDFYQSPTTKCPKCGNNILNRVFSQMTTNHPEAEPERTRKVLGNKIECKCKRCNSYWVGFTLIEHGIENCVEVEEVIEQTEKRKIDTKLARN